MSLIVFFATSRISPGSARQFVPLGGLAELPLELAQEHLLPHDAPEVTRLVVAEADERQRVPAVEPLIARLQVDRREVGHRRVVVVAAIDHEVRPAQLVDHADEAPEVDVDEVVDLQPRELLHRLEGERGAVLASTQRVRGVDAIGAVARYLDTQVARDRQHRDALRLGVEAHQDEGVGAADVRRTEDLAAVAAEEQDRHRLAGQGLGELLARGAHRLRVARLDLRDRARQPAERHAGAHGDDDHEDEARPPEDRDPQPALAPGPQGRRVACVLGHRRLTFEVTPGARATGPPRILSYRRSPPLDASGSDRGDERRMLAR